MTRSVPLNSQHPAPSYEAPRFIALCVFALLLSLMLTFPAFAAGLTPATLLDPTLKPQPIRIVSLADGQLQYFGANRRLQNINTDKIVRIAHIGDSAKTNLAASRAVPGPGSAATHPIAILTDGQRLFGQWAGPQQSPSAAGLAWTFRNHRLTLTVDQLKFVRFAAVPGATQPTSSQPELSAHLKSDHDIVALANGDRLAGFVSAIDASSIHITPSGSKTPVALPITRVAALYLANPTTPAKGDQILTLAHGSRLLAANLSIAQGKVSFTAPLINAGKKPLTLSITNLAAVDFLSAGYRLTPLVYLPRHVTAGGKVFGLPWPPRAVGGDLHLHAPVTLQITLPAGAIRLAAGLSLDLPADLSAQQKRLPGCALTVIAGNTSQSFHFDAVHLRATLNMPLPAASSTLTVTLIPAATSILARLTFHHPMVLTKSQP